MFAMHQSQKLKEFEAHAAKVLRHGVIEEVETAVLVPGDVIEVCSGDKVPADCRLGACEVVPMGLRSFLECECPSLTIALCEGPSRARAHVACN